MSNIKYRPDIDGLRAIAVLSVVINHIDSALLPGGFIGVDIFFVISGFLITSQIVKEIMAGRFSIAEFYKRRINRILPALLVVIIISLIVGIFILSPTDIITLTSSSFYSVIGASNIFFWHVYGNYFTGNREEAILLHTWSLGVEEQFYVIWPLFLIVLLKISKKFLLLFLSIVVAIFLYISEFGANNFASASYYFLPTRFFELALGGLLACSLRVYSPKGGLVNHVMIIVGFALILVPLFLLNKNVVFPGINALYPCLGTSILIWCGASQESYSKKILSNKILVFIGLLSYSLYLIHWPIISYLHYVGVGMGMFVGSIVLFCSIFLAWLSLKYIEIPFRKSGTSMKTSVVFLRRFGVPVIALLLISLISNYFNGFQGRFDPGVARFEKMSAVKPNELRKGCHVPTALYRTEINDTCRLGNQEGVVDGLLIGDSFANHFSGMVDILAKADDVSITDYTMDSCAPLLNYDSTKLVSYSDKCKVRNEYTYDKIAKNKYKYVILAAYWPDDNGAEVFVQNSISKILQSGAKVIVILNNQSIPNGATCPIRQLMHKTSINCGVQETKHAEYWGNIRKIYPQVKFIDPNSVICQKSVCHPTVDNILLYRDDVHLNDVGSRLIGNLLLSRGTSLLK